MYRAILILLGCLTAQLAWGATLRVPEDHASIQAALDAAQPGDTVLVAAGVYRERIRLRPGVHLRSAGDDAAGQAGLRRAEMTILDGGGKNGDQPGVVMAEGSTLDGFTITRVGDYDEALWKQHFDSHGEALADDEGAVQAEGTVPAVSIPAVACTVTHNLVHHNGDVGIAAIGSKERRSSPVIAQNRSYRNLGGGIGVADLAEAIVRANTCHENLRAGIGCRNASPILVDNVCFANIRAGIGCREGAKPIVRGNRCYQNRRAGIGIRMAGTAPVVEDNECYENAMAGIGCRDGAAPVLRNNRCRQNALAGIGCDGANPLVVGNECRENAMAGIGLRGGGNAVVLGNTCHENQLVAIGVTDGSTATIRGNRLRRTAGAPPLIAVKGSTAWIEENEIAGGGVAAILVQGTATIRDNTFTGRGPQQGNAVWVGEDSSATIAGNRFRGYRAAVSAAQATVIITGNTIADFRGPAIVVRDSRQPAHVFGNVALTKDEQAKVVELQGPAGIVAENVVRPAPPPVQGAAERTETRLRFFTEAEATVCDVTCPAGIDRATIRRTAEAWPPSIRVRLHLRGLESFRAVGAKATIEWSVASTGEQVTRRSLLLGEQNSEIPRDSPYFGDLRIVGERPTLPLREGYFEVTLPAKLLEGNPATIRLEWIDFYRG